MIIIYPFQYISPLSRYSYVSLCHSDTPFNKELNSPTSNTVHSSMKQSTATEHILDTIDDVRASLGGGLQGSQRAFYEELLASLPQFVAVGPQSAGTHARDSSGSSGTGGS